MSNFETALDAIVSGDTATLEALLKQNPELVRERSAREHHSTLLHYVSANGVEDSRQRTPPNIVEITDLLLRAGADVNAESEAYGGGSTALLLTATSVHPENAGVQLELLDLLLAHGAHIDGRNGASAVNACLANGRGKAAEFLASRGARLDLEGAAGVGRLDLVESFFDKDGKLKPVATRKQMADGFAWACEFGKTSIVEFLLDRGMEIEAKLRNHGQTGLHWAACGGHVDTVKLLVKRGAPVNATDETNNATPLSWTLYGWRYLPENGDKRRYYETIALLIQAGATLDGIPKEFVAEIRCDPAMSAALNGVMQA